MPCTQQLAAAKTALAKAQANTAALSTQLRTCTTQKAALVQQIRYGGRGLWLEPRIGGNASGTVLPPQVTQLCCRMEFRPKCFIHLRFTSASALSNCSKTRAATPVVAAVTKAAPAAAAATATAASLTACTSQLAQATAEIDDIKASLMLQLEDALRQVSQLKADLAAANKGTATAQALADKAVQQRDDAKAASGEHFEHFVSQAGGGMHGCGQLSAWLSAGKVRHWTGGWPVLASAQMAVSSWPQPGRRCRSRCHPACLTCLPALPVCPPEHNQAMPINGREACIHLPCPAPSPCAESLRQLVSQLRAEAKEAGEHLSGLQQTLDHTTDEKNATAAELASCRAELSKATGECWVGGGGPTTTRLGRCVHVAAQVLPIPAHVRETATHLQQMSRTCIVLGPAAACTPRPSCHHPLLLL